MCKNIMEKDLKFKCRLSCYISKSLFFIIQRILFGLKLNEFLYLPKIMPSRYKGMKKRTQICSL